MDNIGAFLWTSIASGVAGNAAYDAIKACLGKGFDRFAGYVANNQREKFDESLASALETNADLNEKLLTLAQANTAGNSLHIEKNTVTGTVTGNNVHIGDRYESH